MLWKRWLPLLALAVGPVWGDSFLITVDTSSLGNSFSGYLDLQFNGAGNPTPSGTALITGFTGVNFNVNPAGAARLGAVTGDLPGHVAISNTEPFNSYFVPFSISGAVSSFSLLVTITGDVLTPPPGNLNGSDFAVLLFGDDQMTPLLTPDGEVARVAISALGLATVSGNATAVPEPASAWLAGAALVAGMGVRRRRA